MSDQDIFEQPADIAQAQTEAQPQAVEAQPDVFNDLLSTITDANGSPKYADVATALQSIPHAQQHISTVESENARLKEELAKREAAQAIKDKAEPPKAEVPQQENLFDVVNKVLDARTTQEREQSNWNAVQSKFSETYGEKASEKLREVASMNDVSIDFLKQMAKTSPQALFKLSGITSTSGTGNRSKGSVNTEAFNPQPPQDKPKTVMGGASSQQMMDMWNWAGKQVNNQ